MAMSAVMSCPRSCARPEGRREFFRQAPPPPERGEERSERIEERRARAGEEVPLELDAERIVARDRGREGWLRESRRQLEQHRWENPDRVPRSRDERLLLAAERLEVDLDVERRANEAYEAYRAQGRMT